MSLKFTIKFCGRPILLPRGDTADVKEYLFDEENDYILDFDSVDADATERGEYLFLGADTMFAGLNVDLATNGASSGSLNLVWEYWNGTSWADLESISGFTDNTSNLTLMERFIGSLIRPTGGRIRSTAQPIFTTFALIKG